MPRGPVKFTQADVKRAIRAVQSCGLAVVRVDLRPAGGVEIVTASPEIAKITMQKPRPVF